MRQYEGSGWNMLKEMCSSKERVGEICLGMGGGIE